MQDTYIEFPDPKLSNSDGLLAVGGDLRPQTLISAYSQGIFPWFNDDQPILWWSPDPRLVLFPERFKYSRSLLKTIRNGGLTVTANHCFARVIEACATRGMSAAATQQIPASIEPDDVSMDTQGVTQISPSTWITQDMHTAYTQLHELGAAHSIEVWKDDQLVGGLYGIKLGDVFFGESMFSVMSNASKVASAYLCSWAQSANIRLIDCQVHSDHLESLGAIEIPRTDFLQVLQQYTAPVSSADTAKLRDAFAQLTAETLVENVIKGA